ncbi:MAG: cofactor-independent phosphoglycerate mutase [Eubacteriales bacterium]
MKYLIVLLDGAADEKISSLGDKTPLEAASIENMDYMAQYGEIGTVSTIPNGMSPGSDTANLSVLGYDPKIYHTGRSPLEAASMGIELTDTDLALRCNLVTLAGDGDYEKKIIIDHSAGDIASEEAKELIKSVEEAFGDNTLKFYPGVSYRHALIIKNGEIEEVLIPPHDILTREICEYLPKAGSIYRLREIMKESYDLLSSHPTNLERVKNGKNPGNSIWLWGQGKKPNLANFQDKYGVKGSVISAVDLIKGIGICAGMRAINVPTATGTIDTDYTAKAEAAKAAFMEGDDFVFIHVEAPDECSHQGDLEGKIKSIEYIDGKIVKPLLVFLKETEKEFRILVLPDHATPISLRTHTSSPVPFCLYDSTKSRYNRSNSFTEKAGKLGEHFQNGYELTDYFFRK